jgi:hypothetical protein
LKLLGKYWKNRTAWDLSSESEYGFFCFFLLQRYLKSESLHCGIYLESY